MKCHHCKMNYPQKSGKMSVQPNVHIVNEHWSFLPANFALRHVFGFPQERGRKRERRGQRNPPQSSEEIVKGGEAQEEA